jgi:hypothetical protein
MPATSFVFEFFLFNSIYQYDWQTTFDQDQLRSWPVEELKERQQQERLEKFMRTHCRSRPEILKRAFAPLQHLEDLDGKWTTVNPDSRITQEHGRSFFTKLHKLRGAFSSAEPPQPTCALFELIKDCRYFVYLVRNNIFHGSKSIGEIYETDQRRRIEVYDIFLKCLVSLFFLAVDKAPVAADYVQLPVRILFPHGATVNIGQSEVADLVASGRMKPEDSRLIPAFFSQRSAPLGRPNPRDALFYPSSGRDILTPLLLGLPYCSQFFFYDIGHHGPAMTLVGDLRRFLSTQPVAAGESIRFEFSGLPRTIHLIKSNNRDFLGRDVDLAFYFHRGDSPGEGGSGQEWDSRHIVDLGHKVADAGVCQILTDGEPGGLHPDLRSRMQTASIPISHRGRDYFLGEASNDLLREMKRTEPESGHVRK